MLLWLKSLSFKIIIYFIFTFYHHIPTLENTSISCPKKFTFTSRNVVYLKSIKDKRRELLLWKSSPFFSKRMKIFFLFYPLIPFLLIIRYIYKKLYLQRSWSDEYNMIIKFMIIFIHVLKLVLWRLAPSKFLGDIIKIRWYLNYINS